MLNHVSWRRAVCGAALLLVSTTAWGQSALELQPGDRICVVGNTFAERLYHFGHFEYLVRAAHPELQLTFRNLAWSADEAALRPRPLDFGSIHEHLTMNEADVIVACYGFNESYDGPDELEGFIADYRALLESFADSRYNGETSPRIAVVAPIPLEAKPQIIGGVDAQNRNIALYAEAIGALAADMGLPYANIHDPVKSWHTTQPDAPMTINGVHLNDYGDWIVAQMMFTAMGLEWPRLVVSESVSGDVPTAAAGQVNIEEAATGRTITAELNQWPAPVTGGEAGQMLPAPVLKLEGLAPGTYELTWPDGSSSRASATAWAEGMPVLARAANAQTQDLRATINYKNRLWFDKYRAVNGYYIYGGRKEPFGVITFPPELARFEERVSEFETRIGARFQQPLEVSGTLRRVED